ncbi:MAG: AsmA family protein [Rhodospirillales bacterium]|nr:AsmA family protein [Rhodospirillales bacterium]
MNKAVGWILGVLGVLGLAIVLVVIFFQWSWLRGPVQSRLSALTGKHVYIDGPIAGTKSLVPHITLNQIRIEEPNFTAAPKVALIDSIAIEIDLRSLLHGKLNFPLIDVNHPVLDLLRNPDGKANWDITAEARGPSGRSDVPIIGRLTVENGKLTYRDVARKVTIQGTVKTIAATGGNGESSFTLEGKGTYRAAPFTIRLKGGSLNDLRESTRPYDVDAAASVGKTKVTIVGTVTNPFKLTDMNLKLTADGDNAEELYPFFGIPAPSTPPYHLTGTLDRDGKAWLIKNFAGTVGKSDLQGSLRFETENRKRIFVGGNLESKNLNFADLGLLVGAPGSIEAGRPVSDTQKALARKMEETGRVLPDAPLNLDEVRNVDADVTFKGIHIDAQNLPLDNLDMRMKLDNALLSLTPLKVGVAGGFTDSNIVIDARNDSVVTDYDVKLSQFQVEQFFKKAGFPDGGSGVINGRIRLHGIGNSVRKSLSTANGQVSAIVDNGTVSDLIANLLGLDIARALGVLISGSKQVPLHCVVADFEVNDGIMKARTLVLDTDAALTTGKGTISLKDEHLDLEIHGDPKNATPIALGGPIEIKGSFKKPSVSLGAEAYARGGAAAALGALLTPVAAILGFIDAGDTKNADCANLEREASTNAAAVPPGTRHSQGAPMKRPRQ